MGGGDSGDEEEIVNEQSADDSESFDFLVHRARKRKQAPNLEINSGDRCLSDQMHPMRAQH